MKKQNLSTVSYLVLVALLLTGLVSAIVRSMPVRALPGASYRYSVTSCSTSDSACVDNSAQAGVYRVFRATLNRNPDSNGYTYWTNSLINGNSLSSMSSSILGSSEWKNKYSGLSSPQFINQTYQFLLYRAPDPDGYNYWLGQLNGGRSRADMVATMVHGSEAMNKNRANFIAFYQPSTPTTPTTPTTPSTPSTPSTPTAPRPSTGGSSTPKPTASKTSQTGLSISDLTVTNIGYNSATITWKTNKAADAKVNFSTDKDDLYDEQTSETKDTNHSIELKQESLKAGKHYYFRVTSNDGSGPATMDSEFDTKAISVIIAVTGTDGAPISNAEVHINDTSQTTGEDGTATFSLPEGTVTIIAQKDSLSKEISEDITVPDNDAPLQISMALGETTASNTTPVAKKKGGSLLWLWILLTLLPVLSLVGFIFWRRRNRAQESSYSDPLEADNYTETLPQPLPDTPVPTDAPVPDWTPSHIDTSEPDYQPLSEQPVPHHSSLPELVGRYGAVDDTPKHEEDAKKHDKVAKSAEKIVSATGTPIPKHSSLKDLVEIPTHNNKIETEPLNDLPVSPSENHKHSQKNHGDDGSLLEINH